MRFLSAAVALLACAMAHGECIDFGPVTLTGRVVRQTHAGPPDYESVTKGDQPIVVYLLQLDRTLCVNQSNIVGQGTRQIQLDDPDVGDIPFRPLLGSVITVTGQLVRGGARHQTRVVILADKITYSEP